jgi:hypothetical protein
MNSVGGLEQAKAPSVPKGTTLSYQKFLTFYPTMPENCRLIFEQNP